MKINCDGFQYIREAEYEPEVDMLRMVVICQPSELAGLDSATRYGIETFDVLEVAESMKPNVGVGGVGGGSQP